jgi:ABC-type multidrug transport system fused ATPase/permease subunit
MNIFSGSIKDNITLWNEYIDEEALIKSAKDACLHDEVTLLKDKYETILQENGRNLSGGIRQRLEIARCLYSQPSILILDEATSAVDSKTEAEIDLNLRKRGCTSIVISHRLSTIRDCDEIIVLSKGKVVQRGKHEDLIKEQGLYTLLTEV